MNTQTIIQIPVEYQSTKKITGGKLLRVKITIEETKGTIENVKINGDFFLYPEDTIIILEENLKNISQNISFETLVQIIEKTLSEQKAAFIGLNSEDLANTIIEAFGSVTS